MQATEQAERPSPARPFPINSKRPSRIEKGTQKVDDHEVKEKASALLLTLLAILQNPDANLKNEIGGKAAPHITEIVVQFGLDPARLKTMGEKQASELIDSITDRATIVKIEAEIARASAHLKAATSLFATKSEEIDTDMKDDVSDSSEVKTFHIHPTRLGCHIAQEIPFWEKEQDNGDY